jgi:protein-S-isoprenylcysteine O-methyltransferase Ste14
MSAELRSAPSQGSIRSAWMLIPPPLLFAGAFVAGTLLQHVAPLALLPSAWSALGQGMGVLLIGLGGALALGCVGLFAQARTTIIPHGHAHRLVTYGPYRLTRNPMYVALTLVYLGVTALTNSFWPLPWLALPLWVLQTKVIPFEEQTLTGLFGSRYTAYSAQVRRWL